MAIGDRIRDVRWDHRLNQSELARRAGIAKNTLSRIELGKVEPSVATLEKLARAMGVDAGELLHSKEPTPMGKAAAPQEQTASPKAPVSSEDEEVPEGVTVELRAGVISVPGVPATVLVERLRNDARDLRDSGYDEAAELVEKARELVGV